MEIDLVRARRARARVPRREELADCARAVLERDGKTILSYGSGAGYTPLRELIAEWFGVDPARVDGHERRAAGLRPARAAPRRAGRRVLVEQPTYDRPLKILREAAPTVVAVAMDDEGLEPDALEGRSRRARTPAFLYTIPTFQNPSGRTLPDRAPPADRRARRRARACSIVEDDPYGLIRFEGEPQPSLFELAGGDSIYTLVVLEDDRARPARRLVHPPRGARGGARPSARNSTYITPVLLSQAVVHEFITRGRFEPNLERVNGLLKARRDAMLAALEQAPLRQPRWSHPEGGYFIWLELPEGTDAAEVLEARRGRDGRARHRLRRRRRTRCGSPTASSRPTRSTRASSGSPRAALDGSTRQPSAASGPRDEPRLRRRLEHPSGGAEGRARTLERERAEAVAAEVAVLAGRGLGSCVSSLGSEEVGWRLRREAILRTRAPAIKGLPEQKTRSFRAFRRPKFPVSSAVAAALPARATPVENSSQG